MGGLTGSPSVQIKRAVEVYGQLIYNDLHSSPGNRGRARVRLTKPIANGSGRSAKRKLSSRILLTTTLPNAGYRYHIVRGERRSGREGGKLGANLVREGAAIGHWLQANARAEGEWGARIAGRYPTYRQTELQNDHHTSNQ